MKPLFQVLLFRESKQRQQNESPQCGALCFPEEIAIGLDLKVSPSACSMQTRGKNVPGRIKGMDKTKKAGEDLVN